MKCSIWIMVLLNGMLWGSIKSHLTSTLGDLAPLLHTQRQVLYNLEVLIDEKKKAFHFVIDELNRYKRDYKKAKRNFPAFIENPITKFTFLKGLSNGLELLENVMKNSTGIFMEKSLKYPTKSDMFRASLRLQRLQSVYQLSVTQIADGLIHTRYSADRKYYTEHFTPMTVEDCYEIGISLYNAGAMREGVSWMLEAYRKLEREGNSTALTASKIIWSICQGYNSLDDNFNFIYWTEKLIDLKVLSKATKADLLVKMDIHRFRMSRNNWSIRKTAETDDEEQDEPKKHRTLKCTMQAESTKEYARLCRGESLIASEVAKRLKCFYFSGHHPYMVLGPMKVEQLHVDPNVFMFHQAITDREMRFMKYLAEYQLQNATSPRNKYVSGKVVFLPNKIKILDRVARRIEYLSGLNQNWTDSWQVNHYGVGDHCTLHHDFWQARDPNANNKLASVLFYLSDVIQGGATVFCNLGLSVYPVKGAALFWKNLRATGAGNNILCHGACPVLRGSKWEAIKWIYKHNQELRHTCRSRNI